VDNERAVPGRGRTAPATGVLVIEDDPAIRRLVREDLERASMQVTEAESVVGALAALRAADFDVIVLDLTLPDGSGLEVLARLRADYGSAHIIVLSGASTSSDRVRGLDSGADDYVVKPFVARELTARVRAVRRRRGSEIRSTLRMGALQIDVSAQRVLLHGALVELTTLEFALLSFLAARPGRVFSRVELLRAVWRSAPEWQSATTVTEHVHRLRAKLETDPQRPLILRTVRGSGYRFDPPADHAVPPDRSTGAGETPGIIVSVDRRVVESDAVADALLTGTAGTGLAGRMLLDLVAPQSRAAAQSRLDARSAGAEPRSQVLLLLGAGGVDLPIELRSEPIVWRGQAAVRSELRLASRESLRLRRQVTGVLSEVAEAVIVTDPHHHIRSWNTAAEEMYGWKEGEVLGRHINDAIPWLDGDEAKEAAEARLHAFGRWHGTCRQQGRDGSPVPIRGSTKLLHDEDGTEAGIVSVNRLATPAARAPATEPDEHDVADLRRGLAHDELEVHYQPVVDLATRRTMTLEALARWNHPVRGLLAPDAFMATAEQSGQILRLGAIVLEAACRQTATWRRDGIDINVAVNLSARELAEPSLVHRTLATAQAAGLDLRCLWLEVTETSLVEDVAQAGLRLEQLAALGVGISIDDFGTGWASLTYLREFPVHVLKIDRTFVAGIDHDASNVAIARSVLSLGAELNLVVVAEGVETEGEHQALRELGCTVGQGYLYGRPAPADEVDLARCHRVVVASA
jgi:PAS domain S-box-containing protein